MSRVVFFGTPDLSVPTLRALVRAGHEVPLVVTQADKRRGRGSAVSPSPVKHAAHELGIPVTSRVADVKDVDADLGVLVAFGRLIKNDILDLWPIVNLHPSLLPRWRGATPAEATILAGDTVTGISLMKLVEEMDAGPLYAVAETEVTPEETSQELYARLMERGNELLVDLLSGDLPTPVEQSGTPTYCTKLTREDFHIDWNWSAEHIQRLTRIGVAWTTFDNKRFQIVSASALQHFDSENPMRPGDRAANIVATANGYLELHVVKPEGKQAMDAKAWINGLKPSAPGQFY